MPLSPADIQKAADLLVLEPAHIQAVISVESNGSGFLPDGRVKILFEGHIFWRQLQARGISPSKYAQQYPSIVYKSWTRQHYSKRLGEEYDRLDLAIAINREAALCSASWGLFQIMGFNHAACGFSTVQDFVDAQAQSEGDQLLAFCQFLRAEKMVGFLRDGDWAGFARRYNGPSYAENDYDTKLQAAFERCKNAQGEKA